MFGNYMDRDYKMQQNKRAKNNKPAKNYLLKANNTNTAKRCKICSKLTIKTPKRRH